MQHRNQPCDLLLNKKLYFLIYAPAVGTALYDNSDVLLQALTSAKKTAQSFGWLADN
jgi:hypothetical protein